MAIIIDTYAWIEYFRGTSLGRKIRDVIESERNLTPTIVIAEIKRKFTEWMRPDFDKILDFIHEHSTVIPLDEATAIMAGEIRAKAVVSGMGIADCILLALARIYDCKVLTGDEHFEDLPEAMYFGGGHF